MYRRKGNTVETRSKALQDIAGSLFGEPWIGDSCFGGSKIASKYLDLLGTDPKEVGERLTQLLPLEHSECL